MILNIKKDAYNFQGDFEAKHPTQKCQRFIILHTLGDWIYFQ